MDARTKTLGEYRVGIDFNPSGDETVTEIKAKTAELIDLCNSHVENRVQIPEIPIGEEIRLWALAMTHFEDAAMWAVKAATKKPRP